MKFRISNEVELTRKGSKKREGPFPYDKRQDLIAITYDALCDPFEVVSPITLELLGFEVRDVKKQK